MLISHLSLRKSKKSQEKSAIAFRILCFLGEIGKFLGNVFKRKRHIFFEGFVRLHLGLLCFSFWQEIFCN